MLQPYGHLATSMNFWRLMLPSAVPGVSIQCEVGQALVDGQLFAWDVPLPQVPPPALAAWQIQHLLYAVGLPVPADLALVKDAATHQPLPSPDALRAHDPATLDFSALFDKWTAVARPVPGVTFSDVTPRLAHQWLTLADRTFVDDVDIFPFVTIGEPPAAGRSTGGANLSNHPLRGSLEERDAFFKRVTASAEARLCTHRARWPAAAECDRQSLDYRSRHASGLHVRQPPVPGGAEQHPVRACEREDSHSLAPVFHRGVREPGAHHGDPGGARRGPQRADAGAACAHGRGIRHGDDPGGRARADAHVRHRRRIRRGRREVSGHGSRPRVCGQPHDARHVSEPGRLGPVRRHQVELASRPEGVRADAEAQAGRRPRLSRLHAPGERLSVRRRRQGPASKTRAAKGAPAIRRSRAPSRSR